MTSASACRPRLVGRPRGIMPAPTASGDVRAWGLLADLRVPRSTAAGAPGLIDGASSPSSRPADGNARTITRHPASRDPANLASFRGADSLLRPSPPFSLAATLGRPSITLAAPSFPPFRGTRTSPRRLPIGPLIALANDHRCPRGTITSVRRFRAELSRGRKGARRRIGASPRTSCRS